MRTLLAIGIALCLGLAFMAGCSSGNCTNMTRTSCDPDGGTQCPANFGCVAVQDAIDPCPAGAVGCCFQICTADSNCSDDQFCSSGGVCAQGRCLADGGVQ